MKRFITVKLIDGSERHFTETDLPLSVGAGSDCQIELPGCDETAAYIGESQGHLFIQVAADKRLPLFHNDRLLSDSVWLKAHDRLSSESAQVVYGLSGDRASFSVSALQNQPDAPPLSPPQAPPPESVDNGNLGGEIPIALGATKAATRTRKFVLALLGLVFLLLGCGLVFVLTARPLELQIEPEPDSVSVSGLIPALRIGSRYLMLPGTYTLEVTKAGYSDYEGQVAVNKTSDNRLSVELKKLPGILKLRLTPAAGVSIHSDDGLLGITPPDTLEISPGSHRLTLSKDRYQAFTTEINIEGEGKTQHLEVELLPDWADITVVTEPPGAQLLVDDTDSGQTPTTLQLLSGKHRLMLKKELYGDKEQTIEVQAGAEQSIAVKLELLPGRLAVTSIPSGAAVKADGQYRGATPVELELPSGIGHRIELSAPGYVAAQRQVELSPGQTQELALELAQERGDIYLSVTPPDARLALNGKQIDTVQGRLSLPAAPQKLVVTAPGYRSVTRTFTPKPGFSQQISIDLEPEQSAPVTQPSVAQLPLPAGSSAGKLILIQPQPFSMGAPRREPGRRANERERQVNMTRPFLLGEKLVTNREFRMFDLTHDSGAFGSFSLNGDEQPVVNVSWEEAVAYLNWLSEKDKLKPFYIKQGEGYAAGPEATNGYRLPSEAEWAYSARRFKNSTMQRYPWPGGFPPNSVAANLADESARTILPMVIEGYNDGYPVSSPVGSFPANPGGFYDMGGNVSEWCHDWYSAYTGKLDDRADPLGPATGTHRVIRGSSFKDGSVAETRLSYRGYHREARNNVGFRIARYP